jgi:putative hydrolase of the HAD superfamily
MSHSKRQGLIFDGDGTLWESQAFYDEAKERFYEIVADQGGLAEYFEAAQITVKDGMRFVDEIDMRNVERGGFAAGRFSGSLVEAYESLAAAAGVPPNPRVSQRLRRMGISVPNQRRSPLPGARETLEALSTDGSYALVLYSAGDETIQLRKLRETGLEEFFEERVHIVPMKDDAALRRLIEAENLDIPSSWMIGNSLRSDINPALRVGLNCIWYHNGGWAYDEAERREPGQIFEIHSLPEAVEIIERAQRPAAEGN